MKSRQARLCVAASAFVAMLLLGPLGFRLLFPFDMRGGPAIFVFGPIFLAIVWGIFAVVLAIWVVARPDFVSRLLASLGYALLLTIAWLAVVWTYSAATYHSSYGPGP